LYSGIRGFLEEKKKRKTMGKKNTQGEEKNARMGEELK